MQHSKTLKLFLILFICASFSFTSSFSLTESVNLFGQVNSVDLVLNDIWIEPENPKEGEAITIHGSVYNAGIVSSEKVSNIITVGYIVNGELLELALLENVLPGIKNGVEISSGTLFHAIDGDYVVTVIINYHDTVSHLRDNHENNIVQRNFKIGNATPSLITYDIYQHYDTKTDKQQITVEGELTNFFQEGLKNEEIIIDVGEHSQKKTTTDDSGRFSFETNIPFTDKIVDITPYFDTDSFVPTGFAQAIYPLKLNNNQALLALDIISSSTTHNFEDSILTIVLFQDSYDNLFKKISTNDYDEQSVLIEDILLTVLPANHEYIAEIYFEGRLIDAFQTNFTSNEVIEREIVFSDPSEIQFRIVNELGEPQSNVIVENWIYSTQSNENGFTDWIKVLPAINSDEPYVAKAIFPNGKIIWSEPFLIGPDEKKVIQIQESDKQ